MLNLIQLIFIFRDSNYFHGSCVYVVNTYVQIIGVLLTTVWCTGTRWYDEENSDETVQKHRENTVIKLSSARDDMQGSTGSGSSTSDDVVPFHEIKLTNVSCTEVPSRV